MNKKINSFLLTLLPGILFLVLWEFLVYGNKENQFLFSSPSLLLKTFAQEIINPLVWKDLIITSSEAIIGLIAGTILGTSFGLFMWINPNVEKISKPYLIIIGAIPVFALAPMLIIWFGTGLLSKVVMAGFSTFLLSTTQAYEGAKTTAKKYTSFAKSLKASNLSILRKIIIPGTVQYIALGLKLNISFAFLGAFIGEFVSSEAGIGHYILKAGSLYDTSKVIFGIILIAFLSVVLNGLVTLVERRFFPWIEYKKAVE